MTWDEAMATSRVREGVPVAYRGSDGDAFGQDPGFELPVVFRGHPGRITRPELQHIQVDWVGLESRRLRTSWLEQHQQPVAHTEHTLANDYLARHRGNLAEYQQIVATTLAFGAEILSFSRRARELVMEAGSPSVLIESVGTRRKVVDEDDTTIALEYFRVSLPNGDVHDDLTDREVVDLAKWWRRYRLGVWASAIR